MKYLKYLNPYHYVAMFFTWLDNQQRKANLISAVNEAERINKETKAKVLVFNSKEGVAVIRKKDLKKRKMGNLESKAFYKTR